MYEYLSGRGERSALFLEFAWGGAVCACLVRQHVGGCGCDKERGGRGEEGRGRMVCTRLFLLRGGSTGHRNPPTSRGPDSIILDRGHQ